MVCGGILPYIDKHVISFAGKLIRSVPLNKSDFTHKNHIKIIININIHTYYEHSLYELSIVGDVININILNG